MTIRKPARLLLVDDDPGLLKLLGMRLVSEGYSVLTAESGPEALRTLSRDKVDRWSVTCGWTRWTASSCSAKSRRLSRECR